MMVKKRIRRLISTGVDMTDSELSCVYSGNVEVQSKGYQMYGIHYKRFFIRIQCKRFPNFEDRFERIVLKLASWESLVLSM